MQLALFPVQYTIFILPNHLKKCYFKPLNSPNKLNIRLNKAFINDGKLIGDGFCHLD